MKDSIKALRELEKRLYAYQYAMAVADYDSETVAPPESSAGRAEAMEVLSRAYFDQLVSADTAALLQRAAADAETEQEKAEVRELQRSYDEIGKIPAEEYAAFTKLTQESMPAWGKATVQKLVNKGFLQGDDKGKLALSTDLLRLLVINDRAHLYD